MSSSHSSEQAGEHPLFSVSVADLAQRYGMRGDQLLSLLHKFDLVSGEFRSPRGFVGPNIVELLAEKLGSHGHIFPVSAPTIIAPAEIPAAVARIAFTDTAALGLVSAPSPQLLSQALDARERLDPADPHGRLLRAATAAGEFSPDPLWQAWFAAARGDFCTAVAAPPAPATTTRPVTRPPSSTAPITTAPPDTPKSAHPRPPKKWKK